MHQANGVQHCLETQMKYGRSPAGRKGRVTGVYTAGETADLILILHKRVYSAELGVGSPRDSTGPSPGPDTTAVGPCRRRVVAGRCQCSNICFTALFIPPCFSSPPSSGVVNGLQKPLQQQQSGNQNQVFLPLQVQPPLQERVSPS